MQATSDPITHKAAFDIPDTALIQITTEPIFHRVTFTVPNNAVRGWLYLYLYPPLNGPDNQNTIYYYDGIVLVEGKFSDGMPEFNDSKAANGTWNNKSFTNLLRNGSAELSGPRVNPWVDKYTRSVPFLSGNASIVLDALLDQQGTSWYFRSAFSSMYQTFWSKFAAGKIFLLSFYAYEILQYLTLVAIFGVLLKIVTGWKSLPWDIALPFVLSALFMWGSAFLRGAPELSNFMNVIPWARYALPSIIPTSVFICVGWLTVANVLRKFGLTSTHFDYSFLALMVSLNIFTVLSIDAYLSGQSRTAFDVLFLITLFAMFCAVALGSKLSQKNTQP
jgi:hypothetical protein